MQCNTPPPTSPTSTTATCRWKRAQPVYAQYSTAQSIVTPASASPRLSLLPTIETDTSLLSNHAQRRFASSGERTAASSHDAEAEAPISEALYRINLETPPPTMAPTSATGRDRQDGTSVNDDVMTAQTIVPQVGGAHQNSTSENAGTDGNEGVRNAGQEEISADAPRMHEYSSDTTISAQPDHNMSQSSSSDFIPSQEDETITYEQLQEEKENEDETDAEEHIDLDYQIPKETMRAAMLAPPQTRASFWSVKMYRGPEHQSLSIHYCRSLEVSERVAQHFLKEKVLGFDIEWRPYGHPHSIKQNASLIQLACEDRIALFHVSLFPGITIEELMPPTLKKILESPDILKVGVAVKGDFTRLEKYLGIQPQGVFELSRLHNLVEGNITSANKVSNKLVGLAAQVLQHLQLPLHKGEQLQDDPADTENVRESDWNKPLGPRQIQYAAADAYAGFRLYHILEWKRKQLRPTPPTRGLCDYDAKRASKPKPTAKKTPKKAKAKDPVSAASQEGASSLEPDQDPQVQQEPLEVDESEEEEGYETASEDLLDSHELEGPAQASVSKDESCALDQGGTVVEKVMTQKRVGRVNLSWTRGPDPEYPQLPQHPEDEHTPVAPSSSDPSFKSKATNQQVAEIHDPKSPQSDTNEGVVDFADPELETALQNLDLDENGKLIEASPPLVRAVKAKRRKAPRASLRPNPEPLPQAEPAKNLDLSDYNPLSLGLEEPVATPPSNTASPTTTVDQPAYSPAYASATSWALNYLDSNIPPPSSTAPSRIRATTPHLRAYHLWHSQGLSVDDVAGHLRDPPLSQSTVAGYILQAIALERLEYDKARLRDIMMGMPLGMRKGRFKRIADKIGANDARW